MAEIDDWREHYELVRASTGGPSPKRAGAVQPRPALGMPSLKMSKTARYVLTAIGFLGFFFFPQFEHRRDISQADVLAQIETRYGDRLVGRYRLVDADPFPDPAQPYDLMVTVDNGSYRAGATVKGEYAVDYGLSAIRIMSPTEVTALDVQGHGRTTSATAASYAPGFLKGLASTVGGMIDSQGEIRAQSDAQAAARGFVIYRINDHDRALFESTSVRRIERTDAGLSVVYVDGWSPTHWSPVYWFFIGLFVVGALSSIASWR